MKEYIFTIIFVDKSNAYIHTVTSRGYTGNRRNGMCG